MSASRRFRLFSADQSLAYLPARPPCSLGFNGYAAPKRLSALLLDRVLLVRFLRSVAYVQITEENTKIEPNASGGVFSIPEVDFVKVNEKLVDERTRSLMKQFAEACPGGSKATIRFLGSQEDAREQARTRLKQDLSAAGRANQANTRHLKHVVSVLKTIEKGAGMTLTVAALFVSAPAALAAGVIGFTYDITTKFIDNMGTADRTSADTVALVSRKMAQQSAIAAIQEKSKDLLAGRALEDIEELEKCVEHLHAKIATKQIMVVETKSLHNAARLTRSIEKNQAAIAGDIRAVARFRVVTFLFAAWEVKEGIKEIKNAWDSD